MHPTLSSRNSPFDDMADIAQLPTNGDAAATVVMISGWREKRPLQFVPERAGVPKAIADALRQIMAVPGARADAVVQEVVSDMMRAGNMDELAAAIGHLCARIEYIAAHPEAVRPLRAQVALQTMVVEEMAPRRVRLRL